jgi:hypothetical protein
MKPSIHSVGLLLLWRFASSAKSSSSGGRSFFRLPGRPYEPTDDDWEETDSKNAAAPFWMGGRDFDLFDSRSEGTAATPASQSRSTRKDPSIGNRDVVDTQDTSPSDTPSTSFSQREVRTVSSNGGFSYHQSSGGGRGGGSSSGSRKFSDYGRSSASASPFLIPPAVADWWSANVSPNIKNWPKLQCRVEPTTTLKIRKTFRPLKTVVKIGADFNTQLGVWQFKSSWEDDIIGGKLTLAGRELQLTKSWQLSVGAVEDLVTRLRLRAAVDLQTWKAYARVGFRTERLAPINVMEGFTLMKQVPLDGTGGHIKLEVKANVALPEPEIEYSTETQRSLIGMGNLEVSIEELNLVLDY